MVEGAGSRDALRVPYIVRLPSVTAVTARAPWRAAETGNYLLVQPRLRKELTRVGDAFRVKLLCAFLELHLPVFQPEDPRFTCSGTYRLH